MAQKLKNPKIFLIGLKDEGMEAWFYLTKREGKVLCISVF